MSEPSLPATYARLVLTTLCWGAVFHVGQYAVHMMSPLTAAAWRFGIAAAIFVPLVAWREGWDLAGLKRHAGVLAVMAAVGVFGFNMGLFYGLQSTSPVNGALIVGVNPALTAMLAALVNRRRPSAGQVAGLVLGLLGVAVVVSQGSLATLASLHLSTGDAWVLLGAFCWALYSALPQRYVRGLSALQIAASTVTGGAVLMVAGALLQAPDFPTVLPTGGWIAVAFMGVFGSVLAYMWFNEGIRRVGPTQAAVCMNFVPIFAALLGVLRGQPLRGAQLLGAALVISGMLVATFWRRAAAPAVAMPPAPVPGRTGAAGAVAST